MVFAFLALAQSDRGAITGTIADPAGAVVAGAGWRRATPALAEVFEAAGTAPGNYTLSQLPADDYTLSVTVLGFKRFILYSIAVEVSGTMRIDVGLEVGSASESSCGFRFDVCVRHSSGADPLVRGRPPGRLINSLRIPKPLTH